MKKWIRKFCQASLAFVLAAGLLAAAPVQAEEPEDEPNVEISGWPSKAVKAGDTLELTIRVTGVDEEESLTYFFDGPFVESEEDFVEGDIVEGEADISVTVLDTELESEEYCTLYIYDENDEIIIEEYPLLRIAQLGAPTVEIIDGVPDEPVYAASKMPIKVEVSNLNPEKTYFVSTGMVRSGLITGKESVELTLAHRALEFPGEAEVTVTLYEVTALTEGGEIDEYEDVCESGTKEYEVMERVSVKLDFTLMEEAVVGQAYPFSVTVTNHSDEDLSNLCLNSYSPRHILEVPWKAEFAYELQDGMEQNEEYSGMVYLPTLKAGETITVKGTITWPKNAAGDASFLVVSVESVEDGENYQLAWADKGREEIIRIVEKAGAGSQPGTNQPGTSQPETNQNGNGQAGGNQNAQNNQSTQNNVPKTGDTASVTGTMAALLVAAAAIVAVMKKRTHML